MASRRENDFPQIDSPEEIEICLNCEIGRCMEKSIYCPLKSEENQRKLAQKKEHYKTGSDGFTPKERAVAAAVKSGLHYRKICEKLHVGNDTIAKVRRALREKGEIE